MRVVTRLAHSRSGVERKPVKAENSISFPEDQRQFVLLPAIAKRRYQILLDSQDKMVKASEESIYNQYIDGDNKKIGVIACGITINYLNEVFNQKCDYPVLKISQYPLPRTEHHRDANAFLLSAPHPSHPKRTYRHPNIAQ